MMKKYRQLMLVAMFVLMALLLTGCGGETVEENEEFAYVLNSTGEYARIVRYKGAGEAVVIPDTLGDKPVQEIGQYTFLDAPHVTSVSIPASVKKIEDLSFHTLPKLATITVAEENISYAAVENVLYHKKMGTIYCYPQGKTGDSFTLPDTVKTINGKAFYNSQLKEVIMTDKVTKVQAGAFAQSKNLQSVTFSNKTSQLYEDAFRDCTALTNVVLPASLTSIGPNCFNGCTSLTEIVVPSKVGTLEYGAFAGCTALKSVVVEGKGVQRIGEDTFNGDVALESVSYAADLMGIAQGAFKNCSSLKSIPLTEKLTALGEEAFAGCTALADVTLPKSVAQVGANAFEGTAFLAAKEGDFVVDGNGVLLTYRGTETNVTVPEGVLNISSMNKNVVSVTVPEGVTTISDGAFRDCAALTEINLPASLTSLGTSAFENCMSLKNFTVPAGLSRMGDHCFAGCTGMEAYAVAEGNVNYYTDQGVLYDKIRKWLLWYPANSSMTTYTLVYGPVRLGEGAVRGAKNLEVFDASAAEEMVVFADYAFADCPNLKTDKTTQSFSGLGNHTFENCTSLANFEMKYTMTNIGEACFKNCPALKSMTLEDQINKIGLEAFAGTTCSFKVTKSSFAEEYCKAFGLAYE